MSAVIVRRGDARLVPVADAAFLLVEVRPDGTRVPAVRSMWGEGDVSASTFRTPEQAAFFAVEVLRAQGITSTLDVEPLQPGAKS